MTFNLIYKIRTLSVDYLFNCVCIEILCYHNEVENNKFLKGKNSPFHTKKLILQTSMIRTENLYFQYRIEVLLSAKSIKNLCRTLNLKQICWRLTNNNQTNMFLPSVLLLTIWFYLQLVVLCILGIFFKDFEIVWFYSLFKLMKFTKRLQCDVTYINTYNLTS